MSIAKLKTVYSTGAFVNNVKTFFKKINEIIDHLNNNPIVDLGYTSYVAVLTQTGASVPVATVLENTLGGTPIWSYNNVGDFICTLTGFFTAGKTRIIPPINTTNPVGLGTDSDWYASGSDNINTVYLLTGKVSNLGVYTASNNCLYGSGYSIIEIRVYN